MDMSDENAPSSNEPANPDEGSSIAEPIDHGQGGESSEIDPVENGHTDGRRLPKPTNGGGVKFTEPLNDYAELQNKYNELFGQEQSHAISYDRLLDDVAPITHEVIGHEDVMDSVANAMRHVMDDDVPPPLTPPLGEIEQPTSTPPRLSLTQKVLQQVAESVPELLEKVQNSGFSAPAEINLANQDQIDNDPSNTFELTPEDIFNEIKVAHAERTETAGGQNLHSFIISKSYSSENVVVLLNMRRQKDGEWVLDKTIAQGLKPETYGGIVSIDQYGFTDDPREQKSIADTECKEVDGPIKDKNLMDIYKKLESIRNLVGNGQNCPGQPCQGIRAALPLAFEELPLTEQIIRMIGTLVPNEGEACNLCDKVDQIDKDHVENNDESADIADTDLTSSDKPSLCLESTEYSITEWLNSAVANFRQYFSWE